MRYALDPPKDEIVREIFGRVACGEPFVDIAADLNARGIKTSRGGQWGKNSFHALLTNERYTGVYIYGDIRIEGGVPQIVDKGLFLRVQEVLKTKKNPQGRHRTNGDYLLTGKLFCGHCKSPMVGVSGTGKSGKLHYYYICQKKRMEKSCDKATVRRDTIEREVAVAIRDYIMRDDVLEWIADSAISMTSLLGFLMLVGTVVNNGILYVDTVNQYRRDMDLNTALIEAGATRLRPILMTTLTTVVSMVPMAMALGDSGSTTQGLALVNIGGLTASTILSLLMLPAYYSLMNGGGKKRVIISD